VSFGGENTVATCFLLPTAQQPNVKDKALNKQSLFLKELGFPFCEFVTAASKGV
jgi:hypothetical protein